MKKIVVAIDFSMDSRKTIRFAIQLASQINAELVFFHVVGILPISDITDYNYFAKARIDNLQHTEEQLARLIRTVHPDTSPTSIPYRCVCEPGEEFSSKIIDFAKREKAHFICTSAGGNGLMSKLFGSVATHLITSSPIPVWVVPKKYHTRVMGSICYASDMIDLDNEMPQVATLATELNAKVNVIHINYEVLLKEYRDKWSGMAKKYETQDIKFQYKKLNTLFPLNAYIKKAIGSLKPSVIILFTNQEKSWYERLFISGKAAEFSFTSKIPLLIYRKNNP